MAKMTKREMFVEIRKAVADNEDMVAFIDHEIELLNKKSGGTRKPTKTQLENETFKAQIVEFLTEVDTPMCIKELQAELDCLEGLSNQRITHLLTALVKNGILVKEYQKRVPYYGIATQ